MQSSTSLQKLSTHLAKAAKIVKAYQTRRGGGGLNSPPMPLYKRVNNTKGKYLMY